MLPHRGQRTHASARARPGTFHAHFGVESSISGGYGASVPFLPRTLATKLGMIDILETIQSVVSSDRRSPWPGPGFVVKATHDRDQIRLWFENPDGATQPAVPPCSTVQ